MKYTDLNQQKDRHPTKVYIHLASYHYVLL